MRECGTRVKSRLAIDQRLKILERVQILSVHPLQLGEVAELRWNSAIQLIRVEVPARAKLKSTSDGESNRE